MLETQGYVRLLGDGQKIFHDMLKASWGLQAQTSTTEKLWGTVPRILTPLQPIDGLEDLPNRTEHSCHFHSFELRALIAVYLLHSTRECLMVAVENCLRDNYVRQGFLVLQP
jgi:hypothetical protein